MSANAWSGRAVTRARNTVATWLPAPCGRCGNTVEPGSRWVVGHKIARTLRPDLTWEISNWQPEHRTCSDASAQQAVIDKARAQALQDAGFPPQTDTGQPPPLPISLPAARESLGEVRPDLRWTDATRDAPPWLLPYVAVPEDVASAPLAMSGPHPEAVGSYGPDLIEWARKTQGVTVRWWQGLSIVRILEHRADGSLCWEEVILSASRRSGKSVIVRLLALWRLIFAPALFEEVQLIVHSASTLRVAKEPMRYAGRWAQRQAHLSVFTNNNNYAIEDDDGHRWIVLPADKTAGLDTCLGVLDEAWAIKPEVVDDDLEPSLLERVSPQLLLVSTAHRRATSLMRGRLSAALSGEDDGRTLILLWAAPPGADPAAPATWRASSPHWSVARHRMIAAKYGKALAGQDDPEFDDPDPLSGWRSQFLNVWMLRERLATRGEAVIEADPWEALAAEAPFAAPDAAAIESWFGDGVSLALAWRAAPQVILSVTDHPELKSAVVALRESGFRGKTTVGSSLMKDPALSSVRRQPGEGRTGPAVQELQRYLAEDVVRHDRGEHLTTQVLTARTLPGADGPRMVSNGRADAVKAAVWAIARARAARSGSPRIILPTGT